MMPSIPTKPGEIALLESERADLEARFLATRGAARRHTLWGLLGGSPGAVILLIVTANDLGVAVAAGLAILVAGVELWRAAQLFNTAAGLERQLEATSDTLDDGIEVTGSGD